MNVPDRGVMTVHESDDRREVKPGHMLPAEPGYTTPDSMIVPHIDNRVIGANAPWKKSTHPLYFGMGKC